MNEDASKIADAASIVAILAGEPGEPGEPSDDIQVICRTIGKQFQKGREHSGRTRAQLAEECGVELSVIEKIESGDVRAVKEFVYGYGVEDICRSLGYGHLYEDPGEA